MTAVPRPKTAWTTIPASAPGRANPPPTGRPFSGITTNQSTSTGRTAPNARPPDHHPSRLLVPALGQLGVGRTAVLGGVDADRKGMADEHDLHAG